MKIAIPENNPYTVPASPSLGGPVGTPCFRNRSYRIVCERAYCLIWFDRR